MKKKLGWVALLSVLFGQAFSSCSGGPEQGTEQKPRVTVQAAAAKKGNIGKYLTVPGTTLAIRVEKSRSPLTGKIVQLRVLEGDPVQKGDTLLSILSRESEAALLGARQMLVRATTEAQRQEAQEALHMAENSSSSFTLTAPFRGAVASRTVNEGEYVSEGADLLEIVDLGSIYFSADVPVPYASQIRKGMPVQVRFSSMPGAPVEGVIAAIGPQADVSSQSIKARISLAKIPSALKVGTVGTAAIRVEEREGVLLVPRSAVYHNDELNTYLVAQVEGDSLALRKEIQVGLMDSTQVEVRDGLKEGNKVVTVGGYELPDSTLVKLL